MTEDDLIKALQSAMLENRVDRPAGYRTREELEDILGLGSNTVLKRLKKLQRAGRLDEVQWVDVADITGRMNPRPAYRLKQNDAK